MTRRIAALIATTALAAAAVGAAACDRVVNLTPPQDAAPPNDGDTPADTLLPLDGFAVDEFATAIDGAAPDGATAAAR